MNKRGAAPWIAANKFGLGIRPGEHAAIARDPRGWLKQQLQAISAIPRALRNLEDSAILLIEEKQLRTRVNELQRSEPRPGLQEELKQARERVTRPQSAQQRARLQAAIDTDTPFAERLVRFWSNHFSVTIAGGEKQALRLIAVPYENEAIRQSLDRSFADLLLAVEQHPAMLLYLDNFASVGPLSKTGKARGRGLNENLAREILELHTLGVDGGYTQQDVTAFARILTGWGVDQRVGLTPEQYGGTHPGAYRFALTQHEPGVHELLGNPYAGPGEQQGEAALRNLAHHPSTARHLARKLVTHFVADIPPPAAVAKVEQVFLDTGGWLPAVHEALVDLDESWDPTLRKLKTSEEFVVSTARACDLPAAAAEPSLVSRALNQALVTLGQRPFTAGSPAGWPDTAALWGSPDALLKRIEWASAMVRHIPMDRDPLQLRNELLPSHPALWRELDRAESPGQAMTLLLSSPQFQWRGV